MVKFEFIFDINIILYTFTLNAFYFLFFVMIFLVYLLILFWIYRLLILFIVILRNNKKINQINLDGNKKYYIVLPVYQEEKLIVETVEFYKKLISSFDNLFLIVVWTTKEIDKNWKNWTLELIKQYNWEKIIVIEADTQWYMAHQVNYAVEYIRDVFKDDVNSSYFHLINIDSRINKNSLYEIFEKINDWEDILLQSTLFIKNFYKIGNLLKAIAIYQSRWTLVEEQWRLLFNRYICKYKLYHIVWHWLIIKLNKFFQYKMLPEDTINEDLHFGFYLSVENEKVYSLTQYEIWDTPISFLEWFKQIVSWFFGWIEYYKYPQSYMNKFNKSFSIKLFIYTLQWFFSSFKWFVTSYYLLFVILYSYFNWFIYLWLLWVFTYFLHYFLFIIWLYNKKFIKDIKLKYFIYTMIIPFIVSIPLTISLFKYLLYKVWFLNFIKNKTVHE